MTKTLKVARVLKHLPKIKFQIYINKALATHHREYLLVFLYLNVPFQLIQRLPGRDLPGPLKMVDHITTLKPHNYFSLHWDRFSEHIAGAEKSGSAILEPCEMQKYNDIYKSDTLGPYLYVSAKKYFMNSE